MPDSNSEKDGSFHDLLHRLFQGGSSTRGVQDFREYRFVTKFDYWSMGGDESLTDEDLDKVKVGIESWIISGVRFASMSKNDTGFQVTIYSNLPNGQNLGRDLFVLLAGNVFPEISKSVAYNIVEE